MKFSAIAREVATLPPTATSRPVSTIPTLPRTSKSSIGTRGSDGVVPHRRKVTISTGGPGVGETTLEVLEGAFYGVSRRHCIQWRAEI
ncbi:hypothetical protein BC629DRAFT_1491768 [Irpex lacteus]|nr:hypothetical protein BC629DRAFT_1491768 [Irpex lacteus]